MNDEFIDADNPLIFNDEADIKRKSKSSTEDAYTNELQDNMSVSQVLKEQVGELQDNLDLTINKNINDNADLNICDDVVMLRHHHEIGVPTRLDASKVETEEQAVDYFINELLRRFRFNQYENMIDAPLHRLELEDALEDALDEINQYIQPNSSWDLLHFVKKGRRYRRLLLMGAAKNVLLSMVSLGTSNAIEVQIEDFGVQDKTSDFMSLYNELKETFQEQLTQMKEYDRLTAKISHFSTGKRRYSAGYNSFSVRTSRIINNGGRLG